MLRVVDGAFFKVQARSYALGKASVKIGTLFHILFAEVIIRIDFIRTAELYIMTRDNIRCDEYALSISGHEFDVVASYNRFFVDRQFGVAVL